MVRRYMLRIACAIVLRHSDLGDIVLRDNGFAPRSGSEWE